MSAGYTWWQRSQQGNYDWMKRNGYAWHTNPSDPTRGRWLPPGWKMNWETGGCYFWIEMPKPKEACVMPNGCAKALQAARDEMRSEMDKAMIEAAKQAMKANANA